jgi:hypothetical protein
MRRTVIYFVSSLLIGSALLSCAGNNTSNEQLRAEGDSEVISAEAEWARSIASLRLDDGGTNNGRTRAEILEVLYTLRERLGSEGLSPDLRGDIEIIRGAVERMYSSANAQARGEWRYMSQDFATLERELNNPDRASQALSQIIARLGG